MNLMKTKDHGRSEQELDLTNLERGVLAYFINLKHHGPPPSPLNRTNSSKDNLMKPKRYAIVLSDGNQVWFYVYGHTWSANHIDLFHSLRSCKNYVKNCGLPAPPLSENDKMTYKFKRIKSSIFNPFIDGEPLEHHEN